MSFKSLSALSVLPLLASSAAGYTLWASSYSSSVTTLDFDPQLGLAAVATSNGCGGSPTWLELDSVNRVLYCLDEGNLAPPGALSSMKIDPDGSLQNVSSVQTSTGPVGTTFYNGDKAIAVADYGAGGISTYTRTADGHMTLLQNLMFPVSSGKSQPHEAILDPTGNFVLFPDLGQDLVRVFHIDSNTANLTEMTPLAADAGSGPRHGVFWSPQVASGTDPAHATTWFFFLVHELANSVSSYSVSWPSGGGMAFQKIGDYSTYGNGTVPASGKPADIALTPDNLYVIVSNRNATMYSVPNMDPTNSTVVPSDSLIVFVPSAEGCLDVHSMAPSGGSFPRDLAISPDGLYVAVVNQNTGNVVVWARDAGTGLLGERLGEVDGLGQVTSVIWDH